MRYRKDAHLSGSNVRSLEGEAFHGAGDGSTSTHHEMVPRNVADSASSSRVPDRWRSQRRGIKRTYGGKRGPASQRTDHTRRPADNPERFAASEAIQISS